MITFQIIAALQQFWYLAACQLTTKDLTSNVKKIQVSTCYRIWDTEEGSRLPLIPELLRFEMGPNFEEEKNSSNIYKISYLFF